MLELRQCIILRKKLAEREYLNISKKQGQVQQNTKVIGDKKKNCDQSGQLATGQEHDWV